MLSLTTELWYTGLAAAGGLKSVALGERVNRQRRLGKVGGI